MALNRGKRDFSEHLQHMGGDDEESFFVSYSDLMTLLMTFFILMMAVSDFDAVKFQLVANSLSEHVGSGKPDKAFDLQVLESAVRNALTSKKRLDGISITRRPVGVVIRFDSSLLYESGKAVLRQGAKPILMTVVEHLKTIPYPIQVEGHTDDEPIETSKFPSNWELSTARATEVVKFLIGAGVSRERLSATGFAETRPIVPNRDDAGRAIPENRKHNRRVELLIFAKGGTEELDRLKKAQGLGDDGRPLPQATESAPADPSTGDSPSIEQMLEKTRGGGQGAATDPEETANEPLDPEVQRRRREQREQRLLEVDQELRRREERRKRLRKGAN